MIAGSNVLLRQAINDDFVVVVVVGNVFFVFFFFTQDYFSLFYCRGKMSSDTYDT